MSFWPRPQASFALVLLMAADKGRMPGAGRRFSGGCTFDRVVLRCCIIGSATEAHGAQPVLCAEEAVGIAMQTAVLLVGNA